MLHISGSKMRQRENAEKKMDRIQECKVRRAGDLDPNLSPLVLSNVQGYTYLTVYFIFKHATGTIQYSATSMNNVNEMSGQFFNGGV